MNSQTDYLLFVYGFTLLLTASAIPAARMQVKPRFAWGSLGFFALLQGCAQWLEVVALGLGDTTEFLVLRRGLVIVSFVMLCECARRSYTIQKKPLRAVWLYGPACVLAVPGALAGAEALADAIGSTLGLTGALVAGLALLRQSQTVAERQRWRLVLTGCALAVYGPAAAFAPVVKHMSRGISTQEMSSALLTPALLVCIACVLAVALGLCVPGRQKRIPVTYRYRIWMIPILAVVLLVCGFTLTNWRGMKAAAMQRERLLAQATAIARMMSLEHVRALTFSRKDLLNPHFQILQNQLTAYARATDQRSIYTQALRDSHIVFGPGNLSKDNHPASAPGMRYQFPTHENIEAFKNGKSFYQGPARDENGHFVSAFAPVLDPLSGTVLLMVGIDIESEQFESRVTAVRFYSIIFIGLLIVVLLAGIALLSVQPYSSLHKKPVMRHAETVLLGWFGLVVTLGLAALVNDFERQSRWKIFSQLAGVHAGIVAESLLCISDYRLEGLGSFIESTRDITQSVFTDYGAGLTEDDAVHPWGWAQAGDRHDGYVVRALVPQDAMEIALGDDPASSPQWADAIRTALRSGVITASDAFSLGPENRAQKGIFLVRPVFEESRELRRPRGFAFAVLRLWTLLNKNRALFPERSQPAVVMGLYQLGTSGMPQLLTASPLALPLQPVRDDGVVGSIGRSLHAVFPLFVFGRAYGLTIEPGPLFLSENPVWAGKLVAWAGLFMTSVMLAFIMVINNRRLYLEQQVRLRTHDLQEQRQQLEDVIVGTRIGTWQLSVSTGHITVNACWAEMVGYELDDITPLSLAHVKTMVYPHDLPRFEQCLDDVLKGRSTLYDCEYRMRSRDGRWVWVQDLGRVMQRSFDGKPQRMSGTHADISSRKDAERKLRKTLDDLQRSNTELEHFAYVASHDLQEPLRMVSSYLELIKRRYQSKLDSDADEFINFAVGGARRMQNLINDLLAYSRVGTKGQPFMPTDCNEVVQRSVANLKVGIAESGAQITYADLPTVMADSSQLTQLFQNLINNAIKYRGGELPRITIEAELKDKEWLFSVQDNGIGIEPRYFERIFIIFQRLHTKSEHSGTGIGLAVCKKIVERHNGIIWVSSVPGEGSTFYFSIPVSQAEA
jgi:PAS domain S-box-containing protein